MHKPKHITACDPRPGVHLHGTTALAVDQLIVKTRCKVNRAVGASTVCHNNLSTGRSRAQVPKKWSYQRRLVENWNNDRNVRETGGPAAMPNGTSNCHGIVRSHFC